jgi:hypothetical protein
MSLSSSIMKVCHRCGSSGVKKGVFWDEQSKGQNGAGGAVDSQHGTSLVRSSHPHTKGYYLK